MKNKEVIIGIIVGLLATVIGTTIYLTYLAYSKDTSLGIMFSREVRYGNISTDIAWGTAFNFVAFYSFLKFNREKYARGVLIVTLITAVLVMGHKLLS